MSCRRSEQSLYGCMYLPDLTRHSLYCMHVLRRGAWDRRELFQNFFLHARAHTHAHRDTFDEVGSRVSAVALRACICT